MGWTSFDEKTKFCEIAPYLLDPKNPIGFMTPLDLNEMFPPPLRMLLKEFE
jgi:hypothetical protein